MYKGIEESGHIGRLYRHKCDVFVRGEKRCQQIHGEIDGQKVDVHTCHEGGATIGKRWLDEQEANEFFRSFYSIAVDEDYLREVQNYSQYVIRLLLSSRATLDLVKEVNRKCSYDHSNLFERMAADEKLWLFVEEYKICLKEVEAEKEREKMKEDEKNKKEEMARRASFRQEYLPKN